MAALRAEAGVSGGIAPGSVSAANLAQEVTLVTNSIKSSDYVPGVLGWNISGTGVAEFSNIYVRGDINAETGTIGYWNISSPGVERTIGGRKLFGTFLESADFGASDDDVDTGVYVGLFKSYFEDSVPVTGATRLSNVVTITSPNHGYLNGDFVIVDIDNDSTNMYGSGSSPVRIIEVSKDTFKYQNSGTDTVYVDGSGNFLDHNVTGTSTLYVKDVAGLYLQDYGRALFDYGYFSNEGVSYVSAETPNLVYNASFEYVEVTTFSSRYFSSDSWVQGTSTISSYDFNSTNVYLGDSFYAGKISWDETELSTYVRAQVNQLELSRLDFYKNNRELYLNFDIFYVQENFNKVSMPTTGSFFTTSSEIITIVCPGHGLAVDDLVYFDFNVTASGYLSYTDGFRIHTVLSVDGDSFTVENKYGAVTASPVTVSRRYTTAGPYIFKYIQPVLDLNDIKISFVTDNSDPENPIFDDTTSLYDVLTDVTIADWEDEYRYWSHSVGEFENWYLYTSLYSGAPDIPYRPISSMGVVALNLLGGDGATKQVLNIKISSAKLESYYRKLSSAAIYASGAEFYLSFPEWVWEGTESDANTAPTKRNVKAVSSAGAGYILDNVMLSPSKKFFYGDSGSSSFYYKTTGDDTSKTDKVSYEAPRQWLDIDLEYQTAELKYMDSVEFKSSDFLKQLFINPGINTIKLNETVFGTGNQERLLIGESSVLNITSGKYKYLLPDGYSYRDVEAYSRQETGTSSAIYRIHAKSSEQNAQNFDGDAGAALGVSVDSDDIGMVTGWGDSMSFTASTDIRLNTSSVVGNANFQMIQGGVTLSASYSSTYLTLGSSGVGIRASSNTSLLFAVTNNTAPRVVSSAINGNQLTSSYQTVYISTADNSLGYVSSSIDTKKNVEPLQLTVDAILTAEPVQFNYKSEEDGSPKHAGFIAEQLVESGLGGYVSLDEDGTPKTVNYEMFVSALQLVARQHAAEIADLNSRLSALEGS